ncbi:MAG: Fe-S oxidoreductase [Gammaproteobacteria bacterium]|nr:Fe-S oxidoreductase [Gammaproteobacteria bacterium]NNF50145.1 Fe-S oxidoreductase [Woeseiaceae bacterium]MBT8093468.1 Fe-S oxidoreductase [Gammaproteobacteria bacterium]MBT8105128.1 Fe-S oxidoreductase [Gammaproteobacteria bacterium]NNK25142.1 Fe-S oxidoreductase [Woeseiaceae bacterium]
MTDSRREGSLEAPTRHPLDWRSEQFYDDNALFGELERVYDICHGCRRCFNLCHAFPTLFDLIDESDTMEMDGVAKKDYWQVVDHCYLCDMCYMTKCPYVPPHEWNVDFPHLMLRAKAARFRKEGASTRDKILSATDRVGKLAGIPVVVNAVNAVNRSKTGRKLLKSVLGVHENAPVPEYHSRTARKRLSRLDGNTGASATATEATKGKVALFTTCYCNRNHPDVNEDIVAVFEHNGIAVTLASKEVCCGMPKLELGDLESVGKAKETNIPALVKLVDEGWDIVTPIPSCTLMFKQELPLMFPDDADVIKVRDAMFDPFEYLMLRHKEGLLKTDFKAPLGKVTYQVPCHLRVQNIGLKTRDALQLVPDTTVEAIERCSGHDGTYAVKQEFHDISKKIARPVVNRLKKADADHFTSDCPMAAEQIVQDVDDHEANNPMGLLRKAYGI